MESNRDITAIQACVTNPLHIPVGDRWIAGVIGDAPSRYSKSPALWNAAFRATNLNAVYLPFDVAENRLKDFISVLKNSERALGINVTVPHKVKVIDYLDELDPGAARIGAVNTIVRTRDGRLLGYNTDGEGFIESILKPQPGRTTKFIESLDGVDVLLLGAGGSARAVAFHVSELMRSGRLIICNRTLEHAQALARELTGLGHNVEAVGEQELATWAPKVRLIINSTTKGQGGLTTDKAFSSMEPYSALAPAHPAEIELNTSLSLNVASSIPKQVRFYDLIYFPEETVFLRHGRMTGHQTMNGKTMIINQAVIAFCKRICVNELQSRSLDAAETYRHVLEVMYKAW